MFVTHEFACGNDHLNKTHHTLKFYKFLELELLETFISALYTIACQSLEWYGITNLASSPPTHTQKRLQGM